MEVRDDVNEEVARPEGTAPAPVSETMNVLVAGSVSALITLSIVLSFASLLFGGVLSPFVGFGTALFLVATIVMNLVAVKGSSFPGAVLAPQDTTTAVLAATMGTALAGVASVSHLSTALVIVAVTTLMTSVFMLVLGARRLGRLIRYIPVPVMGGFLASTGWLLLQESIAMMMERVERPGLTAVSVIAAMSVGLFLALRLRQKPGPALFPTVIGGAVVVFTAIILLTDLSLAEARGLGLLPEQGGGAILANVSFGPVDWTAVLAALPGIAAVPLLATMGLLLNIAGLEEVGARYVDLDRELRVTGTANLFVSAVAAPAGYHVLSPSVVPYRLGIYRRSIPLIVATICAVALVGGGSIVGLLPLPIVAGVIAMVGFSFLFEWVVDAASRMARHEYLVMIVMLVIVGIVGFVPGVIFGILAAVTMFTVRYSRIDPIRHSYSGQERRSTLERSPESQRRLAEAAACVRVVELQGFMFFGTAYSALTSIEDMVQQFQPRFLIIDFRRVIGTDATAVATLRRLDGLSEDAGFHLVWSAAPAGFSESEHRDHVTSTSNLDRALEWCENAILEEVGESNERFLPGDMWARLEDHMELIELDAGEVLAEMGEVSDGIFIVERGRIAAELPVRDHVWQRVRSVGAGNVLGELSIYSNAGRTARLRAETDSVVRRLSLGEIEALEGTDPEAAVAFHRALARLLSDRLTASNDSVRALLR